MRSVVVSSGPGVTILPNAAEHDLCPLRRSKAWQHSNSGIFGLGLSYMLIPVMEQINNPISNRVMTFGISYKTSRYSTIAKKKSLHLPLWTLCEDCLTARHCIYTRIFRVLSGRSKSIDGNTSCCQWYRSTQVKNSYHHTKMKSVSEKVAWKKIQPWCEVYNSSERTDFQKSTKIQLIEAKEMGIRSQLWRPRIITKPRPWEATAWRAPLVH